MTSRARLAAAVVALAAAACGKTSAPAPGALFNEPMSAAVFRGVTTRSGVDPNAFYPYHPYLAVANAGANQLSVIDLADDTLVPAPVPLRGLVYPVPGRPVLLASGDLGDRKPDLLVVVTAGDLPWLGGSRLEVVRTWAPDGAVVGSVDLAAPLGPSASADVLSLVSLPFDPANAGSVTLVAALSGERIATVTFARSSAGDGTAVDVTRAQATVKVSAPLGFQPIDLAAIPGERNRVFAASLDPLPGGVRGVAQIDIDVTGTPAFAAALDARAPTRLVTAARLAEALPFTPEARSAAFGTPLAPVDRVFAVLDETGCGLRAPIACGLVALDPLTLALVPDPTPAGSMQAPFRAPIPVYQDVHTGGHALAVGFTGPPAVPPPEDPEAATDFLRIQVAAGERLTTGVAGVAASDGALTYVDLARWEVPSQQPVFQTVNVKVTPTRPTGATGTQWLVLVDPITAGTVSHAAEPSVLSTAVQVTGGYTPSDRWTVTHEGALPNLTSRRAEVGNDGTPWLALQVTPDPSVATSFVSEVVRLWDPTLGVLEGDLVVIEPQGFGTCTTFEASVTAVVPPDATRPGGFVRLGHRTPTVPAWDRCVDAIPTTAAATSPRPNFLATFRSGGLALVRGTGSAAVHVGRPVLEERFEVIWQDETPLAAACPLPPSVRWPATPPSCDAACRAGCMLLQQVRLARRIGYVHEPPAGFTGPALAFTPRLEVAGAAAPRDLALLLDTSEGRAPFRVAPTVGSAVNPREVIRFDRSPFGGFNGPRLLVPYTGGVVMDSTPTIQGGSVNTIH